MCIRDSYVAKNVVAAGLADRLELQVSYAIGVARPLSLAVEAFGTGKVPDETILALIERHFDFRPAAIIRDLDLRRPIYRATATYGHFGRQDIDAPWERTDKAEILRQEADQATRPQSRRTLCQKRISRISFPRPATPPSYAPRQRGARRGDKPDRHPRRRVSHPA